MPFKLFVLYVALACLFSIALSCKEVREEKEGIETDDIITLRPTERIYIEGTSGYLIYGGSFFTNHDTYFYLTGRYNNQSVYKFEKSKKIYFNGKYLTIHDVTGDYIKLSID